MARRKGKDGKTARKRDKTSNTSKGAEMRNLKMRLKGGRERTEEIEEVESSVCSD